MSMCSDSSYAEIWTGDFFQSIFQQDDFLSTSFTAEYHKGSDNLLMMKVSTSLAAHKVSLSQSGCRLFKILAISLGNEAT